MAYFIIHFLFCNILICLVVGILLGAKRVFQNCLTSRMQYNLWFLLFGILAAPFLPIRSSGIRPVLSWLDNASAASAARAGTAAVQTIAETQPASADWMNDLSISVMQNTSPVLGTILCILWAAGVAAMILMTAKAMIQLNALKKSALPLQNREILAVYRKCLEELKIKKDIPICSTAFLASPIMTGLFHPRIYLPLHLVADHSVKEIRYILLHELQHYRCKDALINYLAGAAGILYWFNPFVWYALKEIRTDREIACDTSVLKMIGEDAYIEYGSTLINFAEKISLTPFLFSSGISGSTAQIRKRILNIAGYRPATVRKRIRGMLSCLLTAVLLTGFLPALSSRAADPDQYRFEENGQKVSGLELGEYFGDYDGSFVLYDAAADSWQIYGMDNAVTRISPASTYKIYSALFGLQSGVISRDDSRIAWNGQDNAYNSWNTDQTLESAMSSSVTWYFQEIDRQIGLPAIRSYIQEIGYGNQKVDGDVSSYWYDSSLKISPVEQVEMLKKFYDNTFGFSPENIAAVKDSIRLFSGPDGVLYGKTGTQASGGQNVCGWFIGFIESEDGPLFFASNIQAESGAMGAAAVDLTFSVLSDLGIWNQDI